MIQNSELRRINIAASAVYRSDSCARFDGPDFFNTLSHKPTFAFTLLALLLWLPVAA
jgi:hypothetical protein